MILEFLAGVMLASLLGDTDKKPDKEQEEWTYKEGNYIYDHDGYEHTLQDDGYCEDCDDYHDYLE